LKRTVLRTQTQPCWKNLRQTIYLCSTDIAVFHLVLVRDLSHDKRACSTFLCFCRNITATCHTSIWPKYHFKFQPLCLSSLTLLKYHPTHAAIDRQGMPTRSYCHMTLIAPFQRCMMVLPWQQREELSLSSSINPSLSARYCVKQGRILNKWCSIISMMHYLDCAPTL